MVTILHYGDSPTTADLITGDARALLQARFGDAGHGFNLVGKPWAWYGHRDVDITDHGWRSLTGVGSMRQSVYGLGGATLVGGPDARSTFRLRNASQATAELQYLTEPNGGTVTLSANDNPLATIPTDGPADTPTTTQVPLPPNTTSVQLAVTGGQVKLLGIDFRTGRSGILYNSLGLNGASTTVISRTFAPGPWTAELRHAAPSLVIINYGTNESSFGAFVRKQYEGELRLAIAKLRRRPTGRAHPYHVSHGPRRTHRPQRHPHHAHHSRDRRHPAPRRRRHPLRLLRHPSPAMGGDGTFARWFVARPRLVTADFIHPTPQGATLVAQLLVQNLTLGYDRWKHLHNITSPTSLATNTATLPNPKALTRRQLTHRAARRSPWHRHRPARRKAIRRRPGTARAHPATRNKTRSRCVQGTRSSMTGLHLSAPRARQTRTSALARLAPALLLLLALRPALAAAASPKQKLTRHAPASHTASHVAKTTHPARTRAATRRTASHTTTRTIQHSRSTRNARSRTPATAPP